MSSSKADSKKNKEEEEQDNNEQKNHDGGDEDVETGPNEAVAVAVPSPGIAINNSPNRQVVSAAAPSNRRANNNNGKHTCGCCDNRRAVIIANIILLAFSLVSVIILASIVNGSIDVSDFVRQQVQAQNATVTTNFVLLGVGIACSFLAICGAYNFRSWPVFVNAVWLAVVLILDIVFGGGTTTPFAVIIASLIQSLFILPHFAFVLEVKKGTMTRETYQPYSCCCVD